MKYSLIFYWISFCANLSILLRSGSPFREIGVFLAALLPALLVVRNMKKKREERLAQKELYECIVKLRQEDFSQVRCIYELMESFKLSSEDLRQAFIALEDASSANANQFVEILHSTIPVNRFYQRFAIGIGDTSCKNNAKTEFIRCAINPCGPCEGCKDYESLDLNT